VKNLVRALGERTFDLGETFDFKTFQKRTGTNLHDITASNDFRSPKTLLAPGVKYYYFKKAPTPWVKILDFLKIKWGSGDGAATFAMVCS